MTGRNLSLTVNVTSPHEGACNRVRAFGTGAHELHAAILEILGRYAPGVRTNTLAMREIELIFEPERSELRDALDAAAAAISTARQLAE